MRAVIAFEQSNDFGVAVFVAGLERFGCEVELLPQQGAFDMVATVAQVRPDFLVVIAPVLGTVLLQQIAEVDDHYGCAIMLWVAENRVDLLDEAVGAGICAYLIEPPTAQRLEGLIPLAVARHKSRQYLKRNLESSQKKLRERKLVERAKGILMTKREMTEADAYGVLRQTAMNKNQPLVDVACSVIQVSELLG